MTENEQLAAEQAAGLRALAEMIEQNPEFAEQYGHAVSNMNVFCWGDNAQATMATLIRIAMRHKATISKKAVGTYMVAVAEWGPVTVEINANRDQVCERVVVGTETVTKKVKDRAALELVPEIEVTEVVDVVQWVCTPLLTATGGES